LAASHCKVVYRLLDRNGEVIDTKDRIRTVHFNAVRQQFSVPLDLFEGTSEVTVLEVEGILVVNITRLE
jgi:hypothetical protein